MLVKKPFPFPYPTSKLFLSTLSRGFVSLLLLFAFFVVVVVVVVPLFVYFSLPMPRLYLNYFSSFIH